MSEIKTGDQVRFRTPSRTGNNISYGNVISTQGSDATVYFPQTKVRKQLAKEKLELVNASRMKNTFDGFTRRPVVAQQPQTQTKRRTK